MTVDLQLIPTSWLKFLSNSILLLLLHVLYYNFTTILLFIDYHWNTWKLIEINLKAVWVCVRRENLNTDVITRIKPDFKDTRLPHKYKQSHCSKSLKKGLTPALSNPQSWQRILSWTQI